MLRLLLVTVALTLGGCSGGQSGPDFNVQAYNDSSGPVEVRFVATFDKTGEVVFNVTAFVPPGSSIFGEVRGPAGDYHLEAWALGKHHELGPGRFLSSQTYCSLDVSNLDPVRITCTDDED